MRIQNKRLSHFGIALVEVLIASAILGALSVYIMSIGGQSTVIKKQIEANTNKMFLARELDLSIGSSPTCTAHFKNWSFRNSAITSGYDFQIYKMNSDGSKSSDLRLCAYGSSGATESCYKYGNIKINSMSLFLDTTQTTDFSEQTRHIEDGHIKLELSSVNTTDDFAVNLPVKLVATTSSSGETTVSACWGSDQVDEETVKSLACYVVNEGYNTTTGKCDGIKDYTSSSNLAGVTGGDIYDFICPANSFIVGVEYNSVKYTCGGANGTDIIRDLKFQCASVVKISGSLFTTTPESSTLTFPKSDCCQDTSTTTSGASLLCPNGYWVTGVEIAREHSNTYTSQIKLTCHNGSSSSTVGSFTDSSYGYTSCSNNGKMIGLKVRSGCAVNGFYSICLE